MNMNHNISIHSGDPRLMDISLTSPEDLPPYDPSLTCTAPSDGPPSTIGMINSKKINDILFPKLFRPTVRKNCSSDLEKLLKFEADVREFANFLR